MSVEQRNSRVKMSRTFKNLRDIYRLSEKSVLDIGCGFGEYLRLFGRGSLGITTTQEEVVYAKENNLPVVFANAEKLDTLDTDQTFEAIWANNLFEHLLSPHAFLMKLKALSRPETVAIIGVPVVPKIVSFLRVKGFRGALATNHVNFFTHATLRLTTERAGWIVKEVRPFLFKNKILDVLVRPFAPHLYVVALNNPAFVYPGKKLKEWISDPHYQDLLKITKQKS